LTSSLEDIEPIPLLGTGSGEIATDFN
jgi:hypothetical protein